MFVPQKSIPTKAEVDSMDAEEYQQFISDYYNGVFKKAGLKPKFTDKMKYRIKHFNRGILSIVVIGVIYLLINLVMYGVQNIGDGDNKARMKELEKAMNEEIKIIQNYEKIGEQEEITEEQYNDYERVLASYNEKVDEYNILSEKVGSTWYLIPGLRH